MTPYVVDEDLRTNYPGCTSYVVLIISRDPNIALAEFRLLVIDDDLELFLHRIIKECLQLCQSFVSIFQRICSKIFSPLIVVNFQIIVGEIKPVEIAVLYTIFPEFLLSSRIELSACGNDTRKEYDQCKNPEEKLHC